MQEEKVRPKQYPDEARRIADAMNIHTFAGNVGNWAAFRMSDGREVQPGTTYATRTDAVKAARWDRDNTVYLEVQADGMTPEAACACLNFQRSLHAAGFRLRSPDFQFDLSMPVLAVDRFKMIRHLATGGREFPRG